MSRRSVPRIDATDLRDHADDARVARVWQRIEHGLAGDEGGAARVPAFVYAAVAAGLLAFGGGLLTGRGLWRAPAAPVALTAAPDRITVDVLAAGSQQRTFPLPWGAQVALEPGSMAELEHAGGELSTLKLIQGAATVDTTRMNHPAGLTIVAGDATLNTQAGSSVSFRRNADELDVEVANGSVSITSPDQPQRRELTAGQHLEGLATARRTLAQHEASDSVQPRTARPHFKPRGKVAAVGSGDGGWRELHASSKPENWDKALELLKRRPGGLAAAIDAATSPDELMALRDLANLRGGDRGAAKQACKRVVTQFPGRDAGYGMVAAIELEQLDGSSEEARGYFERYLQDEPTGPQAEEAHCRLLGMGRNKEEAARKARDYMGKYPDGRCKEAARGILQAEESTEQPVVASGARDAGPPP